MNVVIALLVGNEAELIEAQIAYHLGLGVAGMVIADLNSLDGTTERLAPYATDPRLVIRRFEEDSLISAQGMRMSEVWAWTLDAARSHFAPDWVVRLDADEFLMPQTPDLAQAFAAHDTHIATRIPRHNAVFEAGPPEVFAGPRSYADLTAQVIVKTPLSSDAARACAQDACPLILTRIQPKVAVRPDAVGNFTTGGHGAVHANGTALNIPASRSLAIVHYWFTTLGRFQRKSSFLLEFEERYRRFMPEKAGWQWSHWAQVAAEGPVAVAAEFVRQFPDPETCAQLRHDGIIGPANQLWSDPNA
jgi:hypothetical protein